MLTSLLGILPGPEVHPRNPDNRGTRLSDAPAALEAIVVSYNATISQGSLQVPRMATGDQRPTLNDVLDAEAEPHTHEVARDLDRARRDCIAAPLHPLLELG